MSEDDIYYESIRISYEKLFEKSWAEQITLSPAETQWYHLYNCLRLCPLEALETDKWNK